MIVLIENGSVGTVVDTNADVIDVGSFVRIELSDENGMTIEDQGNVSEILED